MFAGIELNNVQLDAERLVLRRWRPQDAPRVREIMGDRSMYDFLPLPDPYTAQVAEAYVGGIGHEGRESGTGVGCAVEERASGRLVGSAALRLGPDPDVGYWIAPDARGHGYATLAVRALAAFGFDHLGLHRIGVDCDVRNVASVHTALAAGFRFEGVARAGAPAAALGRADLARFGRVATENGAPTAPAFAPLPGGRLTDGVVALRAMLPADGPAFADTEDAEAIRWGFTGEPFPLAEAQALADRARLDWVAGSNARMAILDAGSGTVAGQLNVRRSGPPQVCGVGYAIRPAFRGRRFTSRALRLTAAWAFGQAGIARLELGAKVGNVASQRAALGAGFRPESTRAGRLRDQDGTFGEEATFVLLPPGSPLSELTTR